MTRIINKLPLALLALLLFSSCGSDENGQEDNIGGNSEKIQFDVVVAAVTTTSSEVQTHVKTSTDGNYTTTWDNDDAIGIYITKGNAGLQSSGNWVDNMKMTYNNGTWTPTFPSGKEYYPKDGENLSFYAYYPYNQTFSNPLSINILDQSSAAALSKSDLLYAYSLDVGKGTASVQLNFLHALAMVDLTVTGSGVGSDMEVTLKGCKTNMSFDLFTKVVNVSGDANSIKMYRVEQSGDPDYYTKYTYRALVPAQTVSLGTELFVFSQTQGDTIRALRHTLTSAVTLSQGQVKPYSITLQPRINPNHEYKVGDYYPHTGFPILGVVFETGNGGKSGKIVSLDQRDYTAWSRTNVEESQGVAGITSDVDGLTATRNMIKEHSGESNFSTEYSAFYWIYRTKNQGEVDGIWYMPAINEAIKFWNVWNANQTGFDSKLTAVGGIPITSMDNTGPFWWTSTEVSEQLCYTLDFQSGSGNDSDKNRVNPYFITRAIAQFGQ